MPVLSAGVASLQMSAIAPTVTVGTTTLVPDVAVLLLKAYAPTISADSVTLVPDVATLTFSAVAPTVTQVTRFTPGVATLSFTATPPTLTIGSVTYELDVQGRKQIVVDQQQGGESYPLSAPSDDLDKLIGDLWLSYVDNTCQYSTPLKIKWLRGFGTQPATDPIGVVHEYDMCITDSDGDVVFDTTTSTHFRATTLGAGAGYLKVLEWVTPDTRTVLRVTIFTAWPDEDSARDWPVYFEPTSSEIDARALYRIPRVVSQLRVATDYDNELVDEVLPADSNIVFSGGYNTNLLVNLADDTIATEDGHGEVTTVRINMSPGLGLGRYPCEAEKYVTRINNVQPDAHGNIVMDAADCYRFDRPLLTVDGVNATVQKAALRLGNDCGPCCECQDFINVYEAIRKLTNKYSELAIRAQAVRDQYAANRDRWVTGLTCRADNNLQVLAESFPGGKVAVAVGICNTTDRPLLDVTLSVSFEYGPDEDGIEAHSSVSGCVACNSTTRKGNSVTGAAQGSYTTMYKLEGSWPNYTMHFDCINPGTIGTVSWVMWFDNADDADVVEFIVNGGKKTLKKQVSIVTEPEADCCEPSTSSVAP